jgi:hypothetical protein
MIQTVNHCTSPKLSRFGPQSFGSREHSLVHIRGGGAIESSSDGFDGWRDGLTRGSGNGVAVTSATSATSADIMKSMVLSISECGGSRGWIMSGGKRYI